MTSQPIDTPDVLVVDTTEDRDTSNDLVPFRLHDDEETILTATRPKMAILVRVLATLGDDSNPFKQAVDLEQLLDRIVDEESAAYLRARMLDPDDDLDLLAFVPILRAVVGKWYGGPTGSPSTSSGSRKRTGRSSTVRQPSKG